MSAPVKLFLIGSLAVALTACGQSEAPSSSTPAKPAARSAEPVSKPNPTAAMPEKKGPTTFRPIQARLRENGEPIEILVPEDMTIESGRMLEYRIGEDGKYYLRSVIPQ